MWLNPINATELTIQNNIVTGSWGYGMLNVQTTPTRYAEDHNNWAGMSIRGGTGNINTNPNLSPAPALVPQSGSPVIDAGSMSVPGATYTNACDGQPLSYCGTTADIGAIETGPVAPSAALRVSFKVRGGKLLKRGYLYVVARCSQPCRLTAQAQEQIKKRRKLGTRRRTLVISNPAKARTVRLKLNKKDRRLGKRRRLVLKVSVTARATSGGPTAIASRKLTVRRKRR